MTIALQYCVDFCHTSTWINHRYTYVPSLLNFPPTSHFIPSPVVTEHQFELPESYSKIPLLSVRYMIVYASMPLSPFVPPSPSCPVSTVCSTSTSSLLPCKWELFLSLQLHALGCDHRWKTSGPFEGRSQELSCCWGTFPHQEWSSVTHDFQISSVCSCRWKKQP